MPKHSKKAVLGGQARELVVRLRDYFERELQNNGPFLPLNRIVERVAEALDIDLNTVSRITREKCGKDGLSENKLSNKKRTEAHTGVKPYECPQCGKFFTQSNSMKLHLRTVHLKQPEPHESRNRKDKTPQQESLVQESVEGLKTEHFLSEVKTERDYEEIYQETDDYQVYQNDENPYGEIKVESSEVAMYGNEEQLEVLYEEVYEVQEV